MAARKRLGDRPAVQRLTGRLFAAYLRLLRRTNRAIWEPPVPGDRTLPGEGPFIVAMWHGQHFLIPLMSRPRDRYAVMISRSREGEMTARSVEAFGIRPIRGSGARGRDPRLKGGAEALREAVRALDGGESLTMTADVPKIARRCGEGIVTLARLSGRPIYPVAAVTSRRLVFRNWDRTTLSLPFGRMAFVRGNPIRVARDAGPEAREAARLAVERELDRVHDRANALVGRRDPWRETAPVRAAASAP